MKQTPEFRAQYPADYGPSYNAKKPDYNRCAEPVYTSAGWGSSQCSRKNGHGPHGAWCKQHDPEAVKARREAQQAKWNDEWAAKSRAEAFHRECQDAIRKIAAGHNDPRGLAQEILDRLEAKT